MDENTDAEKSSRKVSRDDPRASFYAEALSEVEQAALSQARKLEGLDEEIALLRVRARSLAEDPDNPALFLKTMDLLVKALGARYRLSKKSQNNLMDAVMGVLDGVGSAFFGEAAGGQE